MSTLDRTLCTLWLLILAAVPSASGRAYTATDGGVAGSFLPVALNDRGQILLTNTHVGALTIGQILRSFSEIRINRLGPASVLWENGTTTPIGLLTDGAFSHAFGLKNLGQVVGVVDTKVTWELLDPITFRTLHAFVWQGGARRGLDPSTYRQADGFIFRYLPGGSSALGINTATDRADGIALQVELCCDALHATINRKETQPCLLDQPKSP